MSTADSDKGFLKPRMNVDISPLDAVETTAKNKRSSCEINYIGGEASIEGTPANALPFKYEVFDFVGGTTPDNTSYPDTIAPIGSTFLKLGVSSNAINAAAFYIKTAAATWSLLTPASTTGTVTAVKTTTYTILLADDIVRCDTNATGAFAVTLPTAASVDGKKFLIKLITGGAILTIDGNGSETIDGALTNTEMSETGDSMVLRSNGTNWVIESKMLSADVSAIKTTTYTILKEDVTVRCNSSTPFTATLPTAVGIKGKEITVIITTGGGLLTLEGDGTETINGALNVTSLRQTNDSITVFSDGANWLVKEQLVDGLYMAEVVVSTAEVLALNAQEISVIAAPGAGKIIIPVDVQMMLDYATTAYDGIAAGEDLVLRYTDDSGNIITTIETTGFLDQAADEHRYVGVAEAAIEPTANAAVFVHLLAGEIATGDSPLKIRVRYKILDLQV